MTDYAHTPDELSDEGYTGPQQDLEDRTLGASPVNNPIAAARIPRRRNALVLIAGAIIAIAIVVVVAGSRSKEETPAATGPVGAVDVPTVATAAPVTSDPFTTVPADVPAGGVSQDLDIAAMQGTPSDPGTPIATSPFPGAPEGTAPGFGGASGTVTPQPAVPGQVAGGDAPNANDAGYSLTPEEVARQAQLDAARAAAEEQRAAAERRQVQLDALEAELQSPTLVAEGQSGAATSIVTRFGGSAAAGSGPAGGAASVAAPAQGATAAGGTPSGNAYDILPGTRVTAQTISEFRSNLTDGQVEIRLTQPLRDRNRRVILPAGTRAFGSASSADGSPGVAPRVSITTTVFVTPNGQVIRDLRGQAGDPETYAVGVKAQTDNQFAQRVLRGAASTAIGLTLSSDEGAQVCTQSVGGAVGALVQTCTVPSPREQAKQDAIKRAQGLVLGPVGDENSLQPIVVLRPGTQLILLFGF